MKKKNPQNNEIPLTSRRLPSVATISKYMQDILVETKVKVWFDVKCHMLCWALTHWGRVTHICVSKLTNIGSDNGLSPRRRQAIIWTNAGIFLIRTFGTNLSEIVIEIQTFSLKKMRLKMSSAKRQPFCLGLNVLTLVNLTHIHQGCFTDTGAILHRPETIHLNYSYDEQSLDGDRKPITVTS